MIDEREITQGNIFGNNDGFGALFEDLEQSQADGFAELGWSQKSNRIQDAKVSSGNTDQIQASGSRNHNRMDEEQLEQVGSAKNGRDEQRKTIFAAIERIENMKLVQSNERIPSESADLRGSTPAFTIPKVASTAAQPSMMLKSSVEVPKPAIALSKQATMQPVFTPKTLPQTLVGLKPLQNHTGIQVKDLNQASEPKPIHTPIMISFKQLPPKPENTFAKIQCVSLVNIGRNADSTNPKPELLKPSLLTLPQGVPPLKQAQTFANFASKLGSSTHGLAPMQRDLVSSTRLAETGMYPTGGAKLIKSNTGTTIAIPPGKISTPLAPAVTAAKPPNNQLLAEGTGRLPDQWRSTSNYRMQLFLSPETRQLYDSFISLRNQSLSVKGKPGSRRAANQSELSIFETQHHEDFHAQQAERTRQGAEVHRRALQRRRLATAQSERLDFPHLH